MTDKPTRIGNGRYEIRSLIGRGGMAEVHRGYDTALSRVVAIKMLRLDLVKDPIFLARFRREAQASASLNHENIVAVYDTGEENTLLPDGSTVPIPYIVMEHVEGHTVHDLISDGQPVPINEAIEITSGILKALEYAHRHNLVHRDIKPGNVMLTNDGKIKVMDFGIARALEDSGATMTQTDAVVGTAQYLSPEQARGEQVDTRSDLYSCGCMLFELLTGRPPFRGDSAVAVAYQHVAEMPPVPSSITHDIPPVIDRVVMKSLAKKREERYQDAASMRIDLENTLIGADVTAPALGVVGATSPFGAEAATSVMSPIALAQATQPSHSATGYSDPTTNYNATQTGNWAPINLDTAGGQIPEDDGVQNEPKKKSRKGLWAAAIILAIVLLGVAGYFFTSNGKNTAQEVTIPNTVIGQSYEEVRTQLEGLGLKVVKGNDIASDTVESGKVAQTTPAPGSKTPKGSEVTVQLSSGAAEITIPDLTGKTQEEARNELEALGLSVGSVTTTESPELKEGMVVKTKPEAGAAAKKGDKVALVLASGDVTIDSSQVIGQDQDSAIEYLSKLGIFSKPKLIQSNEQQPGHVVRFSPEGKVKSGSTVTLYIAQEPAEKPTTNDNGNKHPGDKGNNNGNRNPGSSNNPTPSPGQPNKPGGDSSQP